MIDIKLLREQPEVVQHAITNRGGRYLPYVTETIRLDKLRRQLVTEAETFKSQVNKISHEINLLFREGKNEVAEQRKTETRLLKDQIKQKEQELQQIDTAITDSSLRIPNLPLPSVPVGKDETENRIVKQPMEIPLLPFPARDHQDIGESLGILDFTTAAKLSGARFVILKDKGARLERALINFMLDLHVNGHGYTEILTPYLVTDKTITGTGQLPTFAAELYKCQDEETYLLPTAEVTLTNLHRDEILEEQELPKYYVGYTACFRKEAGSYGKDTRGLIRNHQFNKIELVKLVKPESSDEELETLTSAATEVLVKLGLTYRIIELCTGDLGFAAAKTYDIEVWMPGENRWREISSCSNCTDFQARRMNTKLRRKDGKKEYIHTLNGSGIAVGRTFAAILENYQQPDGSVKIPELLTPYFGEKHIK